MRTDHYIYFKHGQVLLRVALVAPVSIIPPMFHIHLHLYVALTRRTNGRSLGTFP